MVMLTINSRKKANLKVQKYTYIYYSLVFKAKFPSYISIFIIYYMYIII